MYSNLAVIKRLQSQEPRIYVDVSPTLELREYL